MKFFTKALCVFLSALMFVYIIPNDVYTMRTSAADQQLSTDNTLASKAVVTAVGEDVSKRTANSKTVRMSDGSYRLVQYANEVHYEAGGEWLEYDNSLTLSSSETLSLGGASNNEFTTASNPGGLKFGQSTGGKVLSFVNGNKKLEMSVTYSTTTAEP